MTYFFGIISLTCLKYFILQADAHLTKIQHHITGVKVHSIDRNYIFTWTDLFHPNANITMNCLVHVLDEVCKVFIYKPAGNVINIIKIPGRVIRQ